ncbi:hypothetical protein K2Z83_19805 [Oscillochloris sp. ZM17-4]|uniref:hypothetical protein n=1 Tax=Oscillochloris sp. ZM17-4 TaxID=2866714 RepID=UPI001C72E4AD|nr:hypothetical protein [Oscillochloris sp. ZM17-4]MBX0329914.1 hypothetical protein [Oscillochloris sp. ZM17-4]
MTTSIDLTLTDHDILADLARYGEEDEQQRIALVALRLGLQALRHARGEVDALALQQTAERVFQQVDTRFSQHLHDHADLLGRQFSLDTPDSLLQRVVQTSETLYTRLSETTGTHHSDLVGRLEALSTRRQIERRSTQGGAPFEDAVVTLVSGLAHGAGDHCDGTGELVGSVLNAKVGDAVITLGSDCAAVGERVVVEAKRSQAYNREKALVECKAARENRNAQAAIFVWDRASARNQPPLARYGSDIIVLWDEEDPSSDVYVHAAYWLARSLVVPRGHDDGVLQTRRRQVDGAFDQILGLSVTIEQVKKSGEAVVKQGYSIVTNAVNLQGQLVAQVDALRSLTANLAPAIVATSESTEPAI